MSGDDLSDLFGLVSIEIEVCEAFSFGLNFVHDFTPVEHGSLGCTDLIRTAE
jgi:hypothetical protein